MKSLERQECIKFIRDLDKRLIYYQNVYVLHIANERKTSPIAGAFLKQMGVRAGAPDYLIIWRNRTNIIEIGFLEFKIYKGKKPIHLVTPEMRDRMLTDKQLEFKHICQKLDIKHAIPLSALEALDSLIKWGVLE